MTADPTAADPSGAATDAPADPNVYQPAPPPRTRRAYQARRTAVTRQRLALLKLAAGCADCGHRANHPDVLEFDHRPGTDKRFNLSRAGSRAWPAVEAEAAKCDVVCANCHRLRTIERRQLDLAEVAATDAYVTMFPGLDGGETAGG